MPYTAVPDKIAGDVFTAAMWTTYLEANINTGLMRMLADTTLSGTAASIDFTAIPATFAHLRIELIGRCSAAIGSGAAFARLNNDSGANYNWQDVSAVGASPAGNGGAGSASLPINEFFPGASAVASVPGGCSITIFDYAKTTLFKVLAGCFYGQDTTTSLHTGAIGGIWLSAAAVNRLTLFPPSGSFIAGTRATLYGLPA